jgi:hypothetical protein
MRKKKPATLQPMATWTTVEISQLVEPGLEDLAKLQAEQAEIDVAKVRVRNVSAGHGTGAPEPAGQ